MSMWWGLTVCTKLAMTWGATNPDMWPRQLARPEIRPAKEGAKYNKVGQ